MDQQTIILASIGDLEVTRRTLILEIQARDEYIKDLEGRLGIEHPERPVAEVSGNGIVLPEEKEIVIP